ncbi:site-specific DNA-methyltransferase [Streptomyces sp. NBC_01613]|uniref:DNA methyltransferase n=1 Tax=Streptomyces sp. NBC_01613 TaxID=2975896 RepID=UPI00386D6A80
MNAEDIIAAVRARETDRSFIQQDELDVRVRERVSALPWRGQFTPGLVSKLIDVYYPGSGMVFDPFLGSGTTVLESIRRGLPSAGCEINPAALELAGILQLASLPRQSRNELLNQAASHIEKLTLWQGETLFGNDSATSPIDHLLDGHRNAVDSDLARIFATTLLLGMGDKKETEPNKIARAWRQVRELVVDFPPSPTEAQVIAADARKVPLEDGCAGLVVTSPPYVNVFNYHQNYRPAVERIGWNVLPAARTEIGSNRKNRQNRFLTVVQYCIDMALSLTEMARVVSEGGKVVIVVGRESKVRGVAFSNSEIVATLAEFIPGLSFLRWQERKFTNRFGVVIYEDILSFDSVRAAPVCSQSDLISFAKSVAHAFLGEAMHSAEGDVAEDVRLALSGVPEVVPSPELTLLRSM